MKKEGLLVIWFLVLVLVLPVVYADECKGVYVSNKNSDKALDITFVSDFVANNALKKQAEALIERMKITSPFDEFIKDKINVRYVEISKDTDLGCCTLLPMCSQAKVASLASYCPTDEIVVYTDKSKDRSFPCVANAGPLGQQAMIIEDINEIDPILVLHELGHSMGFLSDEYLYREVFPKKVVKMMESLPDIFNAINCEKRPICENNDPNKCVCPKWRDVPGAGCFKGCGVDEDYRDSENDLMKDGFLPGPVDTIQLRSAINRYVDYVKEPLSIEINKKTTDFILKKFVEKNSDWITGNVYDIEKSFSESGKSTKVPLRFDKPLVQLDVDTGDKVIDGIINEMVKGAVSAIGSGYVAGLNTCNNFKIAGEIDPTISIKLNSVDTTYRSFYYMRIELHLDMRLQGVAYINADGVIIGYTPVDPLNLKPIRDCKHLLDIDWNTELTDVVIIADLNFYTGDLGVVAVRPEIYEIRLPSKDHLHFKIKDSKKSILGKVFGEVLDILNVNHFSMSYEFAKELSEDVYSLKDELNANLDDLGWSLKASLEELGLEQLGGMGKPHGMILDFYMESDRDGERFITKGVEIDSRSGKEALRLSGPVHMNTPLLYNRDKCVAGLDLNFKPIDYRDFERDIETDRTKFVSAKLTQTFPNWFIATLWNDGYFCSEGGYYLLGLPIFISPELGISVTKASYKITPLTPPYIDYSTLEDFNGDDIIDYYDIVSKGSARINVALDYKHEGTDKKEDIEAMFKYTIPLVIENPDLTLPSNEGFSFAESYLKADADAIKIEIESISCKEGVVCDKLKLSEYQQSLIEEIKGRIASHFNRALSEIAINPIRDADLNFGEVGGDYFSPPINLDYGEYIAKIDTREIDGKWMIYDFDLVEKCGSGEYCGPASKASVKYVKEVYYKKGEFCETDYSNFEKGKECVEKLKLKEGDLHHYYKIAYTSQDPYVAYDYNLVSWDPYQPARSNGVEVENIVYLTESRAVYIKLMASKNSGSGAGEVENIAKNVNANVHLLGYLADGTSIVAVRSRTAKGVEQGLECMNAVLFDKDCNTFECFPEIVQATIKPTLRSDANDNYVICEQTLTRKELIGG